MKKFKFLTGEIGRSGELVKKFKFLTGEIGRIGELIKKPDFVNDSVNDFDVISDNTMKPIENKSAVPSWVNDFDETGHSDEIVKKFKFLSDNTMKLIEKSVVLSWAYLQPFCSTFFTFFTLFSIFISIFFGSDEKHVSPRRVFFFSFYSPFII